MKCSYCYVEYKDSDLVLSEPSICSLCILGHGNIYYVLKEIRTNKNIERAIIIARSPHMRHRIKCVIPYK